jgi:hypothetical protein
MLSQLTLIQARNLCPKLGAKYQVKDIQDHTTTRLAHEENSERISDLPEAKVTSIHFVINETLVILVLSLAEAE